MKRFFVPAIILLAFLLRFISLSDFPVGFNADEASFGYDAYSILHSGRDQWGQFMPVVLKSFGDYKSPIYSYLTLPSVAILGLTVFSTRLPNVIIGTLAVLFTYLLVREILERYKDRFSIHTPSNIACITALLLALNPWHVMMSRGAFEANLITLFIPAALFFFLKGLKDSKFLVLSALSFGLSLFTYHSAKLIAPVVALAVFVIFLNEIKRIQAKKLIAPLIVILIFSIGLIYSFQLGGGSRISERSITQGALEEGAEEKIRLIQMGENPIKAKIFHNKYQVILFRFIHNYSEYLSTKFLFTTGAMETYYGMIPGIGAIFVFEGLFLIGLVPLVVNKKSSKIILVIIAWLLVSILPASLASGTGFSGNRAEGMLPVFQILETFGILGWITIFKKFNNKIKIIPLFILIAFSVYEISGFGKSYFKNQSNNVYHGMLYGNLEVSEWLSKDASGRNVILSRSISEPQIFVAFVNKWSPLDYQKATQGWDLKNNNVVWVDQLPEYKLGRYTIRSIDWKKDKLLKNTIIVGRPDDFPKDFVATKNFYLPDGTVNLVLVDLNQEKYAESN